MSDPKNLFQYSSHKGEEMRQQYGAVLEHLAPELKGYAAIYVMSEASLAELQRSGDTYTRTMQELFPGSKITGLLRNEADANSLEAVFKGTAENRQRPQVAPMASSFSFGDPANPSYIGILTLPEKFSWTGHVLMDTGWTLPPIQNPSLATPQNINDMKALVVAHEIGHFHQAIKTGEPDYSSLKPTEHTHFHQPAEVYAQRFAMQRIPSMQEAGLIADPVTLTNEVTQALQINTFRNLILNAGSWMNEKGEKVISDGIINHATGFALKDDPSIPEEREYPSVNKSFLKGADDIRQMLDQVVERLVGDASKGNGSPEIHGIYKMTKDDAGKWGPKERQEITENHIGEMIGKKDARRPENSVKDSEIVPFLTGRMIVTDDRFIDALADHLAKKKDITPEAKAIVDGYVQSRDEVFGKPKPLGFKLDP